MLNIYRKIVHHLTAAINCCNYTSMRWKKTQNSVESNFVLPRTLLKTRNENINSTATFKMDHRNLRRRVVHGCHQKWRPSNVCGVAVLVPGYNLDFSYEFLFHHATAYEDVAQVGWGDCETMELSLQLQIPCVTLNQCSTSLPEYYMCCLAGH